MNAEHHKLGSDGEVPAGLAGGLRALYRVPVGVEARVDEAVLAMARERAALAAGRAVAMRRMTRWGMVAAAGLAVGVFLAARMAWTGRAGPTRVAIAEDINGDGVVDILDALALERAIERSASGLVDLNHDGIVDREDVDLIARQVVHLTSKPRGNG